MSVADIDGNVYNTVTIGTQEWTVENLKTTKLNDGTAIPDVTDGTAWSLLTTPGRCWYDNNSSYNSTYGLLYNWYTVNTGKLAPAGWRVPTNADWLVLINYLGGLDVSGGKLKEAGLSHWKTPNTGATNEVGFTAVPSGARSTVGIFLALTETCDLWTSDVSVSNPTTLSYDYGMSYASDNTFDFEVGFKQGSSVRLIRIPITGRGVGVQFAVEI